MAEPWNDLPISDGTWSTARSAIEQNCDAQTGYADVIYVAMAFGGQASGFDRGAAMHLLGRLNNEYRAAPNSFEQSPREPWMWKRA